MLSYTFLKNVMLNLTATLSSLLVGMLFPSWGQTLS